MIIHTLLLNALLLLSTALTAAPTEPGKNLGIIPAPKSVVLSDGTFEAGAGNKVYVRYDNEDCRKDAEELAAFFREEFALNMVVTKKSIPSKAKGIVLNHDYSGAEEGYIIKVQNKSITLSGRGPGLFYACQSLRQMSLAGSTSAGSVCIKESTIEDEPRFPYRGIMQDVGYHIYPVEFIKQEIDYLARYKMNVYHWHLTEDSGWRIESKRFPKLNEVSSFRDQTVVSHYDWDFCGDDETPYGGYYTQDEIRDIVKYAAERHVTVIPEIELPGHTLAVLAAFPELACGDNPGPFKVAETWGIFPDVFCAGKEETFRFLEQVLDEVMELFPSRYIHIGGDECPKDRWEHCKYCQQRIADEGLKNENELQSYFIRRIEKYLNSKGRKIIGWDEILEGGLAADATVMSWRGTSGGIQAARQNHDVIMAPNSYLYFDYIQGDRAQEPFAIAWGYNPIEKVYAYEPIPEGLTEEQTGFIKGVEAPLWTEHMDTWRKVSYMLFPRLMALSEVAWSEPAAKDSSDFFSCRLPVHLSWLDKSSLPYRVPVPGGMKPGVIRTGEYVMKLSNPVQGASIYYNVDGQPPRETDYLYEAPVTVRVPDGQMREIRATVVTPGGRRSNSVRTIIDNRHGTEYQVGTATTSLEPGLDIFSATLAGYGAPGEGRFSLDWERVGAARDYPWTSSPEDRTLLSMKGPDGEIISATTYKGRVFALTSQKTLWRKDLNGKKSIWVKIGYNNGVTYNKDIQRIHVSGDRLYALAADGDVYANYHRTNNNLTARAVAFSRNGTTVVLVGLDLTGFDYAFINSVKKDIQAATGLPPQAILINASHTHFAPVSQKWSSWLEPNQNPDDVYMEQVVRPGIINAVEGALADLHPAHLFFGRTTSRIGGHRSLDRSAGVYDPTTDVILVTGKDNQTENVIFMNGCHPVFHNWGVEGFTLNANFPAVARDLICSATGARNSIFLQGCAGDVNPLEGDYREVGSTLGSDVLACLDDAMQTVDGEISCSLDSLLVPTSPWKKRDIQKFREDNARYPGNLECEKNIRWADIMLAHIANGTMPKTMPIYIHTINIGDWKLVGLSREAVSRYGMEIRGIWPGKNVSVIGYTNDVSSYLPSIEHIRAHTYEGDNSFFWYSQPSIFPEDILDRVVAEVRKNNR